MRKTMYWNIVTGSSEHEGHLMSFRKKMNHTVTTVEINSTTRFKALNLSLRLRYTLPRHQNLRRNNRF